MNKILASTKELLAIPVEVTDFDSQLVMYINMALTTLVQFAFGPEAYQITLTDGDLEDFLPDDEAVHGLVQTYIFTKVRVLFDPPASAAVLKALQETIAEQEWRLSVYQSSTC